MIILKKLTGIFAIVVCLNVGLSAQELNDAIIKFNKAAGVMQTDLDSAIIYFEESLAICDQIGDSANVVKEKIVIYYPGCYYRKAYNLFSVEKNTAGAIAVSKKALQVSEKYADEEIKAKSLKLLANAYSSLGAGYFNMGDNEKAVAAFDSALTINPEFTKAIYNKALIYQKMENTAKFAESIDLFIEKAKADNDADQVTKASNLAIDYYRNMSLKASQANNLTEAIALLNNTFKYGEDKDVYYRLANLNNKQKKFAEGESNAKKGLALETGDAEAKAKFYYELGVAQAGKGDTGNACASFKNSNYGEFATASAGQRKNLKCQ